MMNQLEIAVASLPMAVMSEHIFASVRPTAYHQNILVAQEITPRLSHTNVVSVEEKFKSY
jgi:hypothetical protein